MYFSGVKTIALKGRSTSETEILRDAINGDEKAITWLYKEHGPVLLSVCKRYSDCFEQAQDFFQDGFLKILDKLGSFRGDSGIKTWMYRVMVNHCINELRRPMNKIHWADVEELDRHLSEEADVDDKISVEVLMGLIQQLPPGYRLVLNMYAVENKSHAEIADLLGITEVSSRTQLFKARRMLKKLIEENNHVAR